MKGFFSIKETESASRPEGKILSCASCGFYKKCKTPKMQPTGNFGKQILIIDASPERIDDKMGAAFQSLNADYLKKVLFELGIDMFEDCLLTYSYNCYNPDQGYTYTTYEIDCCRKIVVNPIIKNNKPKLIILLGSAAVYSLIGNRWKKDLNDIERWRGWCIPDQDFKAWICPTYDTFQVKDKLEVLTVWKNDLRNAISHLDIPFPKYKEPTIKYLDNDLTVLNTIKDDVAFDYETTGLKPHDEGHKVICVSIAVSEDLVYVFMMPKSRKARKLFLNLLTNPNIGKIAQNMKYEHAWSFEILGVEVRNWIWDTMLATHVLDNRTGVTGLKFQTYVQFGIVDYDSEVSPYLKAKEEKNANSINRIQELIDKPGGARLLMKYCAYDSIYEYRLSVLQRNIIM